MRRKPCILAAVLAFALLLSLCGCGASDGKTHLTFQIWDVAQRDGMQAMCDAYTCLLYTSTSWWWVPSAASFTRMPWAV